MKWGIYFTLLAFFESGALNGQDGKMLSKEPLVLTESVKLQIDSLDPGLGSDLANINLFRIVYLSDGLKVIGFVAEPKKQGKYPCIIANRGGRWNFSLWKPAWVAIYMGRMASWGYVVVASQYRGSSDGSEGKDEFGGKDLNDVFNLVPVLGQLDKADTTLIGMYGESRGGMMTYQALRRSCQFKTAVVVSGLADAFDAISMRPELEEISFRPAIPNYAEKKDTALKARSAVFWAHEMCKTTPLLIMHGSADRSVDAAQSLQLVDKLYRHKHPVQYILYDGAGHLIKEFEKEMLLQTKRQFDYYLRNGKNKLR